MQAMKLKIDCGRFYTDQGFVDINEALVFDGNEITFKNGKTVSLSNGLAKSIRDYCNQMYLMLDGIQQ